MLIEKTRNLDDIQCKTPTFIDPNVLLVSDKVTFSDGCLDEGLMEEKYSECTETFIESLIENGQKAPALIAKSDSGSYYFMNGHHRLAVALNHDLEILIMIVTGNVYNHWDSSESDYFPDSGTF